VTTHVVSSGDTLQALAARAGVDVATIAAENGLANGHALVPGQRLVVDNRHIVPAGRDDASIVVNLPQRMLFYFGQAVAGLPVAVGRRTWQTPISEYHVVMLEREPTWDVPESILAEARRLGRTLPRSVPPGPANPLGHFWIGLSGGAVGIHGTNAPSSIYGAVTHGCMRLHPDDVAWLFPQVTAGMTVRTVYKPVLLADIGGRVFLEVHPDVYRRAPNALDAAQALASERGLTGRIDWAVAARVVASHDGVARDVTSGRAADHRELGTP
jgi:L,D-transpeptidase ErfK/SrfK